MPPQPHPSRSSHSGETEIDTIANSHEWSNLFLHVDNACITNFTVDFIEPFLPLLIHALNERSPKLQLRASTLSIGFYHCGGWEYGYDFRQREWEWDIGGERQFGEGAKEYRNTSTGDLGFLMPGNNEREERESFWRVGGGAAGWRMLLGELSRLDSHRGNATIVGKRD